MCLFYSENISNNELSLDESKHCILSLRKQVNDEILITEGKGVIYIAKIIKIKNHKVIYTCIGVLEKYVPKIQVNIIIAPPKNKVRFEWFLEKATELGVNSIYPIISEKSERKKINHSRCQKILIAAMKQSKNPILPRLNKLITFKKAIENSKEKIYIAHCQNTNTRKFKNVLFNLKNIQEITLFIGPEGDFSEKEVNFAKQHGAIPVSLGKQILRTETAGIVGCSMINLLR